MTEQLELGERQAWSGRWDGGAARIAVVEGRVLVTVERGWEAHLVPGPAHAAARPREVTVTALVDSAVRVARSAPAPVLWRPRPWRRARHAAGAALALGAWMALWAWAANVAAAPVVRAMPPAAPAAQALAAAAR